MAIDLSSPLDPLREVIAVSVPYYGTGERCGNQHFLSDLATVLHNLNRDTELRGGNPVQLRLIRPIVPSGSTELIDHWARDQFLAGFHREGATAIALAAIQFPRGRGVHVRHFIESILPAEGFHVVSNPALNHCTDDRSLYGGNILLTPFVEGTGRTLVIGSCSPEFREWTRHIVKPDVLVQCDTNWLHVGHIDEILAFVPSESASRGLAVVMPSAELLRTLVSAGSEHPHSPFFSGKWYHTPDRFFDHYAESGIEELLGHLAHQESHDYELALTKTRESIRDTLSLDSGELIPFPMEFSSNPPNLEHWNSRVPDASIPVGRARSVIPNVVNLLPVCTERNRNIIVSRPHGPKLGLSAALQTIRRVGSTLGVPLPPSEDISRIISQQASRRISYWAAPGEIPERIPLYFIGFFDPVFRSEMRHLLNTTSSVEEILESSLMTRKRQEEYRILSTQVRAAWNSQGSPDPVTPPPWRDLDLLLPEPPFVDLIEAWIHVCMAAHGVTVHFVDSWEYHLRDGGVHCATNCIHDAPMHLPDTFREESIADKKSGGKDHHASHHH